MNAKLALGIFTILIGCCYSCSATLLNLDVNISDGALRGEIFNSRLGREFVAFTGIPYAQPPVDELRFEPAQPPTKWTTVRENIKIVPICLQRTIFLLESKLRGQEDCLYLNVYTPNVSPDSNLPVMVYFHGGGLEAGSGTKEFYGPTFLLDKDIVLVVINYRLGPLGFLSTGDAVCPGNEGLKDQVVALRWVQENIQHFGGDANLVTIFGESAGGSAVETHMSSPLSKGLFHRAIIQSGSSLSPWFISRTSLKEKTKRLAAFLGCEDLSSKKLIECMRTRKAIDIIESLSIFEEWQRDPMFTFRAVVEDEEAGDARFLTAHPEHLLKKTVEISSVPVLSGFNSEEGILRVTHFLEKQELLEQLSNEYEIILPLTLFYKYTSSNPKEMTEKIMKFYFENKKIGNDSIKSLIDLYSDAWFSESIDRSARYLAARPNSEVYFYYFAYDGDKTLANVFGNKHARIGVCHADELLYLFPYDFFMQDYVRSKDDNNMISLMTDIWTEFAKNGKPPSSIKWSPLDSSETKPLKYLHIKDSSHLEERVGLLEERIKFWNSLEKIKQKKKDEL